MTATGVFEGMDAGGHEQVVYCNNPRIGLRAIVAIHDTTLGPALGGVRMWPYDDGDAALMDVLRLSRGMTYKNALAGLEHGGGKAVIVGDPAVDRTEARMRCFGRFLDSLGGRYITAEDVGMTAVDMEYILQETPWVTGTHEYRGGSGDPSPFTAQGTLAGIRACLRERFGHVDIGEVSYAVQGAGHVGTELISRLRDHDARVFVCDVDPERVQRAVDEFGCVPVDEEAIFDTGAEVFVPCALGGVINPETLSRLRCDIVAGAANNQLATTADGDELHRRGIVYAPDYAINAGGVMNVSLEMKGYSAERAHAMAERIEDTISAIFERARAEAIPTWLAADRLAEARIAERAVLRSSAPATPAGAIHVPSGRG
ncbi:Glu/Leu/Phe/Val dehydrogenase dimerization domain-containing protein [Halofilum ochraceum]|uniref:Glu/Leu/Phe/Val dehydrogenase dimerization domain-containing protein n=1 Tax=Halofilum ochraceum TaxID=1611323 RepID=UPI001FE0E50B|nr:Glu/Leu/Phe/Val dehydrogenase dimerization domain-containing protein [Halofilum ochraceum]